MRSYRVVSIFCSVAIKAHGDHDHDHSPLEVDGHLHHKEDLDKFAQEMAGKGVKNMNAAQLQFYYYKSHDLDFDDKLDGLELMQKMMKEQIIENEQSDGWGEVKVKSDEDWMKMVDKVLETMDTNNDGFINFLEFKTAQERDAERKDSSLTPSNVWK